MHLRSPWLGSVSLACGLVLAAGGCRNLVAESQARDMTTPLPSIAWASGTGAPQAQARAGMPLVATSGLELVGFGGSPTSSSSTWSYSLLQNAWQEIQPANTPSSGRVGHCEVYLPSQNAMLIVGGHDDDAAPQNAPLLLSLTKPAFTALTGTAPEPTSGCAAAWLASSSTAIIFGGNYGLRASSDTWSFNPVTQAFALLSPAHAPSPRMGAALVSDPGAQGGVAQVLLFGGIGPSGELNDLWRWNGSDWGELPTASDFNAAVTHMPRPVPRSNPGVALDAKRRLLYVFGGQRGGIELNDLWRLDLRTLTWQNLKLTGVPTAREQASVAYDQAGDRVLIFGGLGQSGAVSDGWALNVH